MIASNRWLAFPLFVQILVREPLRISIDGLVSDQFGHSELVHRGTRLEIMTSNRIVGAVHCSAMPHGSYPTNWKFKISN